MKRPFNPFITTGYAGPAWFCDRKEESAALLGHLKNGQSVTLTSIRRMGKTGLVRHVLAQLPKEFRGFYADIQPAEGLNDLLNILATALLAGLPEKSTAGKALWEFIRSLRPTLTFDHLSGIPQVSIDSKPDRTPPQIMSLLEFLEKQPYRAVVAIDEFQQIVNFPEKNTDAWLRSVIQKLRNVVFIFCGSQQHLMTELFTSPSRPFYRSTSFLKLDRIPQAEYKAFIIKQFRDSQRQVPDNVAAGMLDWAKGQTYYVQLICNRVFGTGVAGVTEELWQEEARKLVSEAETVFFSYRGLLTHAQWSLLKAIAADGKVYTPTAQEFLARHGLGTSATVIQSLNALIKKELAYSDYDAGGKQFYSVYDLLFRHWMKGWG